MTPGEALPDAKIRGRRWFGFAWIVPLLAAIVAGWLVWERVRDRGPEIVIAFADGGGVRPGATPIRYRGVNVGEVTDVGLSADQKKVLVTARLQRSAAGLARDGTTFWIVRPRIGLGSITGLGTVLTGPVIQAMPGKGSARRTQFEGLENAPIALESAGLQIILRAERPRSIGAGTPVYYRGVQVGVVQKVDLSPNATSADVHVLIYQRYATLVREGTAFWNTSGVSVKGGILSGVEVNLESLRALAVGGIEFATPSASAHEVPPDAVFFLYDAPKKEWLSWLPKIPIPAQAK